MRGGVTPGCVVMTGALWAYGVWAIARGAALGGGVTCASWLADGNRASSEIFSVGATRGPEVPSRAPQPPQNRESGAFSVPQLAQRIPSQA